jgi:pantoate--beta-alanine ligase
METLHTKAEVRALTARWRAAGQTVALVPTMGYLHAGHLSLVAAARARADRVVVSIFVNPTQFGPTEDFATYPRDADRDLTLLRDAGADAVFLPEVAEIYPDGAQTIVETTHLSRILIGRQRPGHFRGVATVVTKLFNIVQPDIAAFGEKDFQQLTVIRRMVWDLDMPVAILGVPTVREPDGLALSSRNVRLNPADRAAAPVIFRALKGAEGLAATGVTAAALIAHIRATLAAEPRAGAATVDLRCAETLAPLRGRLTQPAVALVTVRFGAVLLIDQHVIHPPSPSPEAP